MKKSIVLLEAMQEKVLIFIILILTLMIFLCLYHAIRGPKVADRIIAINMMGTLIIVTIAILSVLKGEGYLVDICIIYAMISFLAVIVLTKVFMGVCIEKQRARKEKEDNGDI